MVGECAIYEKINHHELIKVVQDMVRMPSTVPPGNEREVGEYIVNYLGSKGIETKMQEVLPNRFNVIARLKGKGTAAPIMFTGHMDVVPVSEDESKLWQTEPYSGLIDNGFLHGRGSSDMKGGLGAAMVAMSTLADHKIQPPGDIILAATMDEEGFMLGSKALLNTPFVNDAKKMVVCEPTNMELVTVCRGRTWAEVKVEGQAAHAAKQGAGINAINRAVKLMNKINNYDIPHKKHALLGNSFWQVTEINGGSGPAIIPDSCKITVDARLVPGQMPNDIWEQLEKIIVSIKEEEPDFTIKINVIEAREPWETSHDDPFVKVITEAYNLLGIPKKFGGFLGTTDGTVLRRGGIETVILGPGDIACAHKENERVLIKELMQAAQIYIMTMMLWE